MKITALTNGPLLVEGHPQFTDQNGKAYVPQLAMKFALCRCGDSSQKPFCDGTHSKNGFLSPAQSAPQQPRQQDAIADWEGEGGRGRELAQPH
jgi:CDGSH-type Zn-finger protein